MFICARLLSLTSALHFPLILLNHTSSPHLVHLHLEASTTLYEPGPRGATVPKNCIQPTTFRNCWQKERKRTKEDTRSTNLDSNIPFSSHVEDAATPETSEKSPVGLTARASDNVVSFFSNVRAANCSQQFLCCAKRL